MTAQSTTTEQGAFFDGHEDRALRLQGTGDLDDAIGRFLEGALGGAEG